MSAKRFVIFGAGLSGLVCAFELLNKGQNVVVFEKLDMPGGQARTLKRKDYYIDSGPHLFHSNDPEIVAYWDQHFPGVFSTPALHSLNYLNNRYYEYPISLERLEEQFPSEHEQILREIEALDSTDLASAKSFEEYTKAMAGPTLQKIFFDKYPSKLWGIPTSQLSPKFAPRRLQIRDKREPFHAGEGRWVGVAKYGCGTLANILDEKIKALGGEIFYNTEISALALDGERIDKVLFENRDTFSLSPDDEVISTLPITRLANFLDIKNDLTFRHIKTVNILVDSEEIFPPEADWVYFSEDRFVFHRVTLQNRFSPLGLPKGHSLLCCEIVYNAGDETDQIAEDELMDLATQQLVGEGFFKQEQVKDCVVVNIGPVYPGYKIGYEHELQAVKASIDKYKNLYFTGSVADFAYSDLQVAFTKSIDLVNILTTKQSDTILKKAAPVATKAQQSITINDNRIAEEGASTYLIAEIGLNHNGQVDLAKKLIDGALQAGVQAVKLQTYKKGRISAKVRSSRYFEEMVDTEESISALLDRIIFSQKELEEVFDYARSRGIDIFSTPFDSESLRQLEGLDCPAYKISSMDLVNVPLIRDVARTGKPIILSTGMARYSDIELALDSVLQEGNGQVCLLHCVSSYPCPPESANLRAIETLKKAFGTLVGYSDHTTGWDIALASVTQGARVIEKHYTLDQRLDGPDHNFSLTPKDLKEFVTSVRRVEMALGDGVKAISNAEYESIRNLRRSIFAKVDIPANSVITPDMLEIKSPGIGLHPKHYDDVVGATTCHDIESDFPIVWEDIST